MKLTCAICDVVSDDVRPGLVAWVDPAEPYAAVDRCLDRDGCRERVLRSGEPWPVLDPIEVRQRAEVNER